MDILWAQRALRLDQLAYATKPCSKLGPRDIKFELLYIEASNHMISGCPNFEQGSCTGQLSKSGKGLAFA